MQDEPDATRLLDAMADTLEAKVLHELTGSAQHQVRVVVNLCRILAREHALEPGSDTAARAALADLLDTDAGIDTTTSTSELPDTRALWQQLAQRIESLPSTPADDGDAFADAAHRVVDEIVRAKLAVAKPDYALPRPTSGES